ncbi:AbrB/MazE/SpoVT family DNA-binding domain-containing protein [Paractinoplanes atraurantiacus]|nr:AbrB/MazE/SpoVT family DNA-binding domain-containing protein [Actinoplanes atraurantiacus]
MTDHTPPAVIPPVIPTRRTEAPSWNQRGALAARPPLPLLKLSTKRIGTAVYGLCTLDAGGRIADKAILTALGWEPQQRLEIRVSRGLVGIYADSRGIFTVKSNRLLYLPLAARRWCELGAGSRVLLAAYPEGGLLLVHPPTVLDEVVAQVFDSVWGAEG